MNKLVTHLSHKSQKYTITETEYISGWTNYFENSQKIFKKHFHIQKNGIDYCIVHAEKQNGFCVSPENQKKTQFHHGLIFKSPMIPGPLLKDKNHEAYYTSLVDYAEYCLKHGLAKFESFKENIQNKPDIKGDFLLGYISFNRNQKSEEIQKKFFASPLNDYENSNYRVCYAPVKTSLHPYFRKIIFNKKNKTVTLTDPKITNNESKDKTPSFSFANFLEELTISTQIFPEDMFNNLVQEKDILNTPYIKTLLEENPTSFLYNNPIKEDYFTVTGPLQKVLDTVLGHSLEMERQRNESQIDVTVNFSKTITTNNKLLSKYLNTLITVEGTPMSSHKETVSTKNITRHKALSAKKAYLEYTKWLSSEFGLSAIPSTV